MAIEDLNALIMKKVSMLLHILSIRYDWVALVLGS
jgi:hypothetical protein